MNPIVHKAQQSQLRKDHPNFRPGDTVKINVRLKEGEGDKERIQPFEGIVMSRRGELLGESFTVRRVSFGIGVERIFPVHSPMISSIVIVQAGRVRRAKLNYLRKLTGKAARVKRARGLNWQQSRKVRQPRPNKTDQLGRARVSRGIQPASRNRCGLFFANATFL
jgi:large subunit ribosomal protein L19